MLSKGNNPIQDKEWNDKVTKAANSFWSAFQMTENGKPKSGLLVYTFCLSFVMLAVYGGAFFVVIDGLYNLTAGLPVFWGNLIQSMTATILGLLVSILLHFVLRDKRHLSVAGAVCRCVPGHAADLPAGDRRRGGPADLLRLVCGDPSGAGAGGDILPLPAGLCASQAG